MQTDRNFRDEREFGFLVGFMLVLLGGWWLYRDSYSIIAGAFLGLGSLLVILGLLSPRSLVFPNRAWMGLAKLLSLFTTPIVLSTIFFVVILPIGVLKRLFGWDPLQRRASSAVSYWRPYSERQCDPRHFEKMF